MAEPGQSTRPSEQAVLATSTESITSHNELSEAQLKSLIENDTFDALKQRFHKKGRGRPTDLPKDLSVTNNLLVQLYFLKEDQYTFADLKKWLETVDQSTANLSERRLRHRVDCTVKKAVSLTSDTDTSILEEYLSSEVDFNALANPLASLGLNRRHFEDLVEFQKLDTVLVTNSIVFELEKYRSLNSEPHSFVIKWLRKLCGENCSNLSDKQLKSRVQNVVVKFKHFNKKQEAILSGFREGIFLEDESSQVSKSKKKSNNIDEQSQITLELERANREIKSLKNRIIYLESDLNIKNELIKQLRPLNISLTEDHKELKDNLKQFKQEHKRLLNENEEIKKTSLYKKNVEYKQSINVLNEKVNFLQNMFDQEKEKNIKLKEKLKNEQSAKSNYKISFNNEKEKNCQLRQMLQFDKEDNEIKIKEEGSSHRYSDSIRKTYYALHGEGNVAATNCSKVISLVAKNLVNIDIPNLPSASSSLNFSNEAHVIAKSQIAEEIKKSEHFIYACDGTSRQKASYLEKHIILSNGKQLSLGYTELVTEDSNTLLETCINALKEICEHDDQTDSEKVFKDVIRKLKGLLSDRAAVMKCFDEKMLHFKQDLFESEEDISTQFLFCNAHFLLALSAACDEAIQILEQETIQASGSKLGRDNNARFSRFAGEKECATLRLLRTTSNALGPRGDEKSGCRQNWLAYCHSKGKKSSFTTYRSNRFNNLFSNATALLYHADDIVDFLQNFNSHSNSLLLSVLDDLNDPRLLINVAVLSFMNVFITEPYWQLMNSTKTYADFPPYVKKLNSFFIMLKNSDFDVLGISVVFDDFPLCDIYSNIMKKIFENCKEDNLALFKNKLSVISNKCLSALNRQLGEFLENGKFGGDINENLLNVLKTCPLTNLTGERQFGDLDYSMNTRRNCSLFMRSTKSMWKHNKTTKYVAKKSPHASKKLLEKAIKYGPIMKKKSMDVKKAILEQRIKKGNLHRHQKAENEIKHLQRKQAAISALIDTESLLVSNRQDLDKMYSGPQSLQRLREQIRYRNLCCGEKIRISGTKKVLYERLISHIESLKATE